jgi:hypothetical protein
MKRLWLWAILLAMIVVLLLPMPLAERFTSPTQDGQYLTNPVRAYGFVIAAARVSDSARLGQAGKALDRARELLAGTGIAPTKVELLFFPSPQDFEFRTRSGSLLQTHVEGPFVWEVWARPADASSSEQPEVLALLDYQTGEVLATTLPGG